MLRRIVISAAGVAAVMAGLWGVTRLLPRSDASISPHTENPWLDKKREGMTVKLATFGAGCFWGVEDVFRRTPGVTTTAVGYMGGALPRPTYDQVCSHVTGHAEVVQVEFDPTAVTYEQLLDVFWRCHDPTTPNRQGWDVGDQYRSVIFYHDDEQRQAAEASKARLAASGQLTRPIVTLIQPAQPFWRAEEYHQQYFEKSGQPSCHLR